MLKERLREPDAANGFLLDGFPRTIPQAEALEQLTPLDLVVSFDIPPAEIINRLGQRWICPTCQCVYNLTSQPPREPGRCDKDRTALIQRPDDQPSAIATRLKVYAEKTAPLLDFYRGRRVLRAVNAMGTPEQVAARVRSALG
jgi:adenylate kinase